MIKVLEQRLATPVTRQTKKNLLPIAEHVTKKVSERDIFLFRQYLFSKKFELKMDQDELKKIFELDGDEFFNASFDLIYKKLGLPQTLKPKVVNMPMNEVYAMAYDCSQNFLIKNINMPKLSKIQIYSFIRHELQHMLQNIEVYRHRELGEKIIKFYAEAVAKAQAELVDKQVRNFSMEELQQSGLPKELLDFYVILKECISNNNEEEYLKHLNDYRTSVFATSIDNNQKFREIIIKEMGFLPKGSKAESRAEKFYENKINPYTENILESINIGKYLNDVREREAIIAQDVAILDVIKHLQGVNLCYINCARKTEEDFDEYLEKNEEKALEYNNALAELKKQKNVNSLRDLADYFFD